jgi:hypothetical protein
MGFAMGFIAEALVSAVGADAAAIIQARPSATCTKTCCQRR